MYATVLNRELQAGDLVGDVGSYFIFELIRKEEVRNEWIVRLKRQASKETLFRMKELDDNNYLYSLDYGKVKILSEVEAFEERMSWLNST